MYISSSLKQYIKETIQVSKSNVIITDLQKANLIEFIEPQKQNSCHNTFLSSKLLEILSEWNTNIKPNAFILLNSNSCINLLQNDTISYSCQIIFPLYIKEKLEGSIILFRFYSDYVSSSIKSAENLRKFVTYFIENT